MLSAIVVSVVGFILLYVGWEWLRSESQESRGTKIRNAFLIIGGLVAVLLAIWRSRVSERQTQVSNEQTKAALKQAGISHQSLLSERFQKGAEMLGSNTISVRLGGIYALKRIARDDPDIYHVQVMELFCAFVLNPTKSEAVGDQPRAEEGHLQLTSEVQAVMTGIGNRTEEGLALEQSARLRMELPGASLRGVGLFGANLSYVWFQNADLSYAYLCVANRSFANFLGANLEYANLVGANLSHANLIGANLSGAKFIDQGRRPVKGLTQAQLDMAYADPANPSKLQGVVEAETDEPVVSRGKPLHSDA